MQGQQQSLVPIEIQRTEPAPFGSAECTHYGIGFDRLPYVLKRVTPYSPYMPASELICTRIAGGCQIACVTGHIANLPDGEQAFASRAEGGAITPQQVEIKLLTDVAFLKKVNPTLAAIYAMDVFVRNLDRHVGNYLVRSTFAGSDLMAMDHGQALLAASWPAKPLKLPMCNTVYWQNMLRQREPLDLAEALAAIDRLSALGDDWLEQNTKDIPFTWWSREERIPVFRWWVRHRKRRLSRIRRRLQNGTV